MSARRSRIRNLKQSQSQLTPEPTLETFEENEINDVIISEFKDTLIQKFENACKRKKVLRLSEIIKIIKSTKLNKKKLQISEKEAKEEKEIDNNTIGPIVIEEVEDETKEETSNNNSTIDNGIISVRTQKLIDSLIESDSSHSLNRMVSHNTQMRIDESIAREMQNELNNTQLINDETIARQLQNENKEEEKTQNNNNNNNNRENNEQIDVDNMSYDELLEQFPIEIERAKTSDISMLPVSKYKMKNNINFNDKNKSKDPNYKCCICLEMFKTGDNIKRLPCMHIFHNDEIESWLKINVVCPICRHPVKNISNRNF